MGDRAEFSVCDKKNFKFCYSISMTNAQLGVERALTVLSKKTKVHAERQRGSLANPLSWLWGPRPVSSSSFYLQLTKVNHLLFWGV